MHLKIALPEHLQLIAVAVAVAFFCGALLSEFQFNFAHFAHVSLSRILAIFAYSFAGGAGVRESGYLSFGPTHAGRCQGSR